jgi:23S rRNA (cytosine1962-C5)-methyltransferase
MADTESGNDLYELIDSGGGRVLEKMGGMVTSRAVPSAWWKRKLFGAEWRKAVEVKRIVKQPLPVTMGPVRFLLTPGGSVRGLTPELRSHWQDIVARCGLFAEKQRVPARVLHLFGGAGGATLAAAKAGASVTHVDVSADAVKRAREHVAINTLANRDIRWVVDDPVKFAQREKAQAGRYDVIVIDPFVPKDGRRGAFELERDLGPLLATVSGLLSDKAVAVLVFCRQGGVSPTTLQHLVRQEFGVFNGAIESGELMLSGEGSVPSVPCGAFARWLKAA